MQFKDPYRPRLSGKTRVLIGCNKGKSDAKKKTASIKKESERHREKKSREQKKSIKMKRIVGR